MPNNRIAAYIAAGEGARAKKLALAIMEDPRFEPLEVNAEIPLDVQFVGEPHHHGHDLLGDVYSENIFNAEFKEPADYVSSALAPQGHLYMQLLQARELGDPLTVVVLGGDNQVSEAIIDALQTRHKGKELGLNIASYESRLIDFEAQCEAIGCPVRRWQVSPWKRLLSTAHKILTGGDLMGYRPRPAEGERELTAASCLFKGIGPETMRNILADYQLCFAPRNGYARPLEEIAGIGKKRAEMINPHVRMTYLERVRA